MFQLAQIKVRTRLAAAFLVMLVLSALSTGLAVYELSSIQSNLEDVVQDNNVKIRISNQLSAAASDIAIEMREAMLRDDPAQRTAELALLAQARKTYGATWDKLTAMPASAVGQAKRAEIRSAHATTVATNDRVLQLLAAGNQAEAVALMFKEAGPAMDQLHKVVMENVALQDADNEALYKHAVADYELARTVLVGANLVIMGMAVLLGWLVTRSITGQLGGEPADAARVAQRVAEGDLATTIALQRGDSTSVMAQLAAMQAGLARVVGSVRANAQSVATASAQISQGNQDLSGRTEQQAAALEQTSAAMDQLGSTVRSNADNARQANQLALGASEVATRGGGVVNQAVATMKGINESSRKIADIIGVIDGIAFQTNILALNAAVEAARAGEQGRGFAVVAGEVRLLAQRSAEAAREIKSLITASVESVERGSAQVDQAGATMTEVVAAIQRVTDIMAEISRASAEQSSGVAQVGEAVVSMDQATQQNAALVEESAAAAESLRQQAHQLVGLVEVFTLDAARARA
jgi:methyl-accepting chemotaxis protein